MRSCGEFWYYRPLRASAPFIDDSETDRGLCARSDPRRRRVLRLADVAASVRSAGTTSRSSTTSRAATPTRARGGVAHADRPARRRGCDAWRELTGREIGFHRLDVAQDYDELLEPARRAAPGRRRPLRRAARRAVLDEELAAQALHGRQQRQRHAQPAGGARRERSSTPTSSTSARWASTATAPPATEDPRGLPARAASTTRRTARRRAGDPLPGQPGQRLPHDQDARPAPVRVLQQERRGAASPTCTRASSGARRPTRRASTSG